MVVGSLKKTFPLPVRVVVVDLDGTLLDTAPDIAEAVRAMLHELGLPPASLEKIRSFVGNGTHSLVRRALTGTMDGQPEEALFDRAMALFDQRYAEVLHCETRPYPGAMEGLDALRDAGFPLACLTNKPERFTLPLLAAVGMKAYFDLVISGDSLPKRKPDPLPLLHIAAHYGVAPDEMLLVGDSLTDANTAHAAGCPVFLVSYGYNGGMDVYEQDCTTGVLRSATGCETSPCGIVCNAVIEQLPEILDRIRKIQP